jgi:imidazolonepropionase-like amidohydrolase
VIRFGKLWDDHEIINQAVVLVYDDKIRSVTANGSIPAGTQVIDLSPYTGIPGMIDMHTHVTYYCNGDKSTDPRHQKPRREALTVVLSQKNGMKALAAGVTTLRDLNAPGGADLIFGMRSIWGRLLVHDCSSLAGVCRAPQNY